MGAGVAREGETEKRARGLFPARPTSGKTPLIGTWLPVGATNFAGVGGRRSSSASALGDGDGGGNGSGGGGDGGGREKERERENRKVAEEERQGGSRPVVAGGGADARVLHTPLHLLVNRINQRHHGLSPIPLHLAARLPSLTSSPAVSCLTAFARSHVVSSRFLLSSSFTTTASSSLLLRPSARTPSRSIANAIAPT